MRFVYTTTGMTNRTTILHLQDILINRCTELTAYYSPVGKYNHSVAQSLKTVTIKVKHLQATLYNTYVTVVA